MLTDEEISMILNTYMYIDYKEAADNMELADIISELSDYAECQKGGEHYREYTILSKAVKDPEIGKMVIGNQSQYMDLDKGTNACTFTGRDGKVFVVFRGTGDGEWPDNGLGMTQEKTTQQERALHYFETVVEKEAYESGQRLVVTGHSKGGNKAQYVMMRTKYGELIDSCINIDGQGFSGKAIRSFQKELGSREYENRRSRIKGIFGENDYVNVLGTSIVPEKNISYVRTPVAVKNFAGYHDITYMFASPFIHPDTGEKMLLFSGSKNAYVPERGALSAFAAALSLAVMKLDENRRDGCSAVLMHLMEQLKGEKKGLNGEKLKLSDLYDFFSKGLPLIRDNLFGTEEGVKMLTELLTRQSFSAELTGKLSLYMSYAGLMGSMQELDEMEEKLSPCIEQVERTAEELPWFIKNNWMLSNKIRETGEDLKKSKKELHSLSEALKNVVQIYKSEDERLAQEL